VLVTIVGVLLLLDWALLARIARRGPSEDSDLWTALTDGLLADENEEGHDVAVLV
jgi:hypothetical protein